MAASSRLGGRRLTTSVSGMLERTVKLRTRSRRAAASNGPTADAQDVFGGDQLIDSYVCWREACAGVRLSYDRWSGSRGHAGRLFFLAYAAALEQEEQAARVYQLWVERVRASKLANRTG